MTPLATIDLGDVDVSEPKDDEEWKTVTLRSMASEMGVKLRWDQATDQFND